MLQTFSVELAFYGGLFRILSFLCQLYVAACYDFATQLQGDDGRADRAMPGSVHRKFTDRGEDGKSVEVHSGVTGVGEEVGA